MRKGSIKVVLAGGTGFVGQDLARYLVESGYEVALLTRRFLAGPYRIFQWQPNAGQIDPKAVEWADAIVNLAGERITDGNWTSGRKRLLIGSRMDATRLLVEQLGRFSGSGKVFVSSSAYGVYGEQGDKLLTEATPPIPKASFLADLCQQWEHSAQAAESFGVRTVIMRIGLVLSNQEGILAGLTTAIRLGVGAPFGSGGQIQSWIHITDLCGLFEQAIRDERWQGPINAVAPAPVSNRELVNTLAQWLGRRIWLPCISAQLLRWRLGEKSEFLLASHRLSADKALQLGYAYRYPTIQQAISSFYRN